MTTKGNPSDITFKWSKRDGDGVLDPKRVRTNGSVLTLASVSRSDAGILVVEASNSEGDSRTEIKLNVKCKHLSDCTCDPFGCSRLAIFVFMMAPGNPTASRASRILFLLLIERISLLILAPFSLPRLLPLSLPLSLTPPQTLESQPSQPSQPSQRFIASSPDCQLLLAMYQLRSPLAIPFLVVNRCSLLCLRMCVCVCVPLAACLLISSGWHLGSRMRSSGRTSHQSLPGFYRNKWSFYSKTSS